MLFFQSFLLFSHFLYLLLLQFVFGWVAIKNVEEKVDGQEDEHVDKKNPKDRWLVSDIKKVTLFQEIPDQVKGYHVEEIPKEMG